jgi:hypothetical protein
MNKRLGAALALVAAAGFGAGFGPGAARADETYMIHGAVWDYYQGYLDKIGHGMRPGVFAITPDGLGATYSWCSETRCRANMNLQTKVLQNCEKEYGIECVVFAVRDEIRVQYEIAN